MLDIGFDTECIYHPRALVDSDTEDDVQVEWEMTLQDRVRKVKGYTTYSELSSQSLKGRTFEVHQLACLK